MNVDYSFRGLDFNNWKTKKKTKYKYILVRYILLLKFTNRYLLQNLS